MDAKEQDAVVCGDLQELMIRSPEAAPIIRAWMARLESGDMHRYEAVIGCLKSLAEQYDLVVTRCVSLMQSAPVPPLPVPDRRHIHAGDEEPTGVARASRRKAQGIVVTQVELPVIEEAEIAKVVGFEPWRLRLHLVNAALVDLNKRLFDPAEVVTGDEPLMAWADGSGTVGDSDAAVGVVFDDRGHRAGFGAYIGKGTNNVAELSAVLYAVRAIRGQHRFRPVIVHTDSQYAIGALTKQWDAKVNQELIAIVRQELKNFRDLKFQHVRGHTGILGNEQADKLAGAASKTRGLVRL
jgi:ribonuclease HI